MTERDTYKYHLKKRNNIVHRGIPNDLDRRQVEHQGRFLGAKIERIDRRATRDPALRWERKGGKLPSTIATL